MEDYTGTGYKLTCETPSGPCTHHADYRSWRVRYRLQDQSIAGGLWQLDEELLENAGSALFERQYISAAAAAQCDLCGDEGTHFVVSQTPLLRGRPDPETTFVFVRGQKRYQLGNHQGSVVALVSDKHIAESKPDTDDDGFDEVDYYEADIHALQDYYPYGMVMPGRSAKLYATSAFFPELHRDADAQPGFTPFAATNWRFGFQGMEQDAEVKGFGNHYTTQFRQYDPRLGRWFSPDPIHHPWQSPYSAMDCNPVGYTDPYGLSTDGGGKKHTVKKGETLSGIAEKYGTTWQKIKELNPDLIEDENQIEAGWTITVTEEAKLPPTIYRTDYVDYIKTGELTTDVEPDLGFAYYALTAVQYGAKGYRYFALANDVAAIPTGGITLIDDAGIPLALAVEYGAKTMAASVRDDTKAEALAAERQKFEEPEFVYRAMREKEFDQLLTTGPLFYLQHNQQPNGETKGAGPFVATNPLYFAHPKTFIYRERGYDMMVVFVLAGGTKDYWKKNSISMHKGDDQVNIAKRTGKVIHKYERVSTNYGFPGESGRIHMQGRVLAIVPLPLDVFRTGSEHSSEQGVRSIEESIKSGRVGQLPGQ